MAEYDNTNTGILFINDRKESDKHPDRKGSINIEGVEYWLSGWIADTSKGKALKLKASPKEQKTAQAPRRNAAGSAKSYGSADSDDVPF